MDQTPTEPASEEELAVLIRQAEAEGAPLSIEGSGSKRHHGPATSAGRRVSLRRLNEVTSYAAGDLVVSVSAGTPLVDLQRTLAEHDQWLPLDPPYAGATIGGILATGSAGPRRLGYGTIKDALLGLRTMSADGVVTRSGGRVVKNVTGFDLHRLQVGAFGTLGIVLEAHLKVASRPAASVLWLAPQPTLAAALRWLLAIQASPLRPVALEALDAGAIDSVRALVPELPASPALAVVGIEGAPAVVERHLRELRSLPLAGGRAVLLEHETADRLWQAFRDAPARATGAVTLRLGARPHDLPALIEGAALGECGPAAVSCHAGNGIARLRFGRPPDGAAWIAQPALQALAAAARARGGYLVAESAPLDLPGRGALPWAMAAGSGAEALARRIQRAWDPLALLNPGRTLP